MAKKNTPRTTPRKDPRHKCGKCALATFLQDNTTLTGELFLLKCPHYKNGEVYHFAKDTACEFFQPRERTTTLD